MKASLLTLCDSLFKRELPLSAGGQRRIKESCLGGQVVALAVAYFAAVTALDVVINVGTIDDLLSTARVLLTIPVAALDAIFILWVFTSLSRTLNQVATRRAAAKLDLYR